jgi:hypothetical protein
MVMRSAVIRPAGFARVAVIVIAVTIAITVKGQQHVAHAYLVADGDGDGDVRNMAGVSRRQLGGGLVRLDCE